MQTTHLLLTRFNVRRGPGPHELGNSLGWLRQRMNLFKQVTLPSVGRQTRGVDRWMIFFDDGTPIEFRAEVDSLFLASSNMLAIYCGLLENRTVADAIRTVLLPGTNRVITTRLDSDDALQPRFIETVRAFADQHTEGRYFINLPQGLIVAGDLLYRKSDPSNPFISLIEPATELQSVWIDQHQRLKRHAPIHQVALRDAWVQHVHGGNLANQIRGVRVSPIDVDGDVLPPALASQLRTPSPGAVLYDNTVGLLARSAGSIVRRIQREWEDARVPAPPKT